MNVEIICVGTELLLGDILNTNAKYLSERLAELGFNLFSQSVVGDNPTRLEKQISLSMARSEIVILSGGLGPTNDDITKETAAKVLGLPLEQHPESLRRIEEYFARTGRVMSENNKKQALTIKGAVVLQNDHGTAPGYFVETKNGAVILLPGPPSELVPMFSDKVVPLLKKYSDRTLVSHNVRLFGVGESVAAERCGDMLNMENPTVATYAKTGEVDIRVTASAGNAKQADDLCAPVIDELNTLFGDNVYGVDFDNLQQRVVKLLQSKNMKLATAESCTAGMLSGRITEIPGSSEVFEMGVTAYANYIKIQALGVSGELIEEKGAVCDEVAAQMAVGIRTMCNADLGVGITGVAGPGQSEGKPAGLVYIAVADKEKVYVRKIMGRGNDRENTRILATSTALDMVRRYLQGVEEFLSFGTSIGEPIKLMTEYSLPALKKPEVQETPPIEERSEAPIIYSDEELLGMFSTSDEDSVEQIPEKLEIEDSSMSFVFDDDDYAVESISALAEEQSETDSDIVIDEDDEATKVQEKPKKKGFFRGLFPCKGDPATEKLRKIIFLIAFVVLIGTMAYLVNYFVEGWLQQNQISSAAEVWDAADSMEKNEDGIFIGFESLIEQNSDVKAWIKIDGTNINNPVYQTKNNSYYVDHDMNKQSSRYGALFIDKSAKIGRESNSQNVVIYGHHMKDGTMFGPLKNYTDISFYKKNPIIDFTTLYRDGDYKVFAVFITNTEEASDNGNVFKYWDTSFATDESFLEFIDEAKKRSIIDTGVDVLGDDEIITLSTCTYEFDDARLVVMARRVRDGETDIYDTSAAKVNSNPLYPQAWYDKKGGSKPTFSSKPATSSEEAVVSVPSLEDVVSGFNAGTVSGNDTNSSVTSGTSVPAENTTSTPASTGTTTEVSSEPADNTNTPTESTASEGTGEQTTP